MVRAQGNGVLKGYLYPAGVYLPYQGIYTLSGGYLYPDRRAFIPWSEGIYTLIGGYLYPDRRVFMPWSEGIYTRFGEYLYPVWRVFIPGSEGIYTRPEGIYTLNDRVYLLAFCLPFGRRCFVYPINTRKMPEKYPMGPCKRTCRLARPFTRTHRVFIGYFPGSYRV